MGPEVAAGFPSLIAVGQQFVVLGLRMPDVGTQLEYLNDFADSLKHTLMVEGKTAAERRFRYPRVVGWNMYVSKGTKEDQSAQKAR
jgi:hypothetical protein